ncbi:phage tail assembly chaperone [Pseudomonas sp. 15FMM2]|uniref:Phage tail assembly chaperone n=1 Tax=Pseudomonas imrae TaxID=2992837 RepID=A0ACC7PEB4_9PSED
MSTDSNTEWPLATPLPEVEWAAIRAQRDQFLRATDFTQLPDFPATDTQRKEVAAYRKVLRDIPEQVEDPLEIVWPLLPAFLK